MTSGSRAPAWKPPESELAQAGAHPPALPGVPGFDETYRWLVDGLPARLRRPAERLPWRLGLTKSPDRPWSDFVRLHPNRELPLYAAQAPGGDLGMTAADIEPFLRAHHLGAFAWLIRDRLEDGQVGAEDHFLELADVFEQRWREAIVEGTGDPALARVLFRRAFTRWRHGTRAEQRVLASGSMRPPIYAAVVREKLGWIGAPSDALLRLSPDVQRRKAFVHAHDLYLVGLQALDDVIDEEEDCALRGAGVPGALRCSAGALVRAAPKLVRQAAAAATSGGFTWFANWLNAFASAISSWRLPGDALGDELESIGLAGEIEEAILGDSGVPPPTIDDPRAALPA